MREWGRQHVAASLLDTLKKYRGSAKRVLPRRKELAVEWKREKFHKKPLKTID